MQRLDALMPNFGAHLKHRLGANEAQQVGDDLVALLKVEGFLVNVGIERSANQLHASNEVHFEGDILRTRKQRALKWLKRASGTAISF